MTFIASSQAIDKNSEFLTYGLGINSDQLKGLDSYSTENDEKMLELLSEQKKRNSH